MSAGDEFIVVLPGTARSAAVEKARDPATDQGDRVSPWDGTAGPSGCQLRHRQLPDDARDLENLLALGDQAQFSVKRSGRDGIAAAGEREPAA